MKAPIVAVLLSFASSAPVLAGTFVYVSNAEDGDIGMYTAASGRFAGTALQGDKARDADGGEPRQALPHRCRALQAVPGVQLQHRQELRRAQPRRASTPAKSSRRRASAPRAPTHPMRAARSEYDAPSVRAADASDSGSQRPARYGQNDREIVLNRKNALFAGHDQGAENWACIASLIETCKLHGVDPQTYFTDVLTKLVNLWPASRLDELMPWAWAAERSTNKLAA